MKYDLGNSPFIFDFAFDLLQRAPHSYSSPASHVKSLALFDFIFPAIDNHLLTAYS